MQATVAARSETGRHDLANLMSVPPWLRPLVRSGDLAVLNRLGPDLLRQRVGLQNCRGFVRSVLLRLKRSRVESG